MLLTNGEVTNAMTLSTAEVRAAMELGGYGAKDITGSSFKGMRPDGTFVYEITFPSDVDDGDDTGNVFLNYRRKAFSKVHYLVGGF
jgi:hypothetical protein